MVNDKLLLNDGSSNLLLNDGSSVLLLNSETSAGGVDLQGQHATVDFRNFRSDRRESKTEWICTGQIRIKSENTFESKIRRESNQFLESRLQRPSEKVTEGRIIHDTIRESYGRIYVPSIIIEATAFTTSQYYNMILEKKSKEAKLKEIKDMFDEYRSI